MEINRVGIDMFQKILTPDAKALHLLAFGLALGGNAFTTFFTLPISYANLPRQQFGNFMAVLFPTYHTVLAAASGVMVGTLAYQHAVIRKHPFDIMDATVYQAFTLASSAAACLVNALVVTPASSKLMYERHRQEKAEGKSYDDAGISDKMDTLNKEFASLHSMSTALNMVALGGVVFHGMWLSKFGNTLTAAMGFGK